VNVQGPLVSYENVCKIREEKSVADPSGKLRGGGIIHVRAV
jgi:hypothetical protein